MIVFIRQTKSLHIKVIFYILSRVAVLRSTNQYRASTESIDSSRIDDDGLMYGWMQECITALSCRQKEANVTFVYVCLCLSCCHEKNNAVGASGCISVVRKRLWRSVGG